MENIDKQTNMLISSMDQLLYFQIASADLNKRELWMKEYWSS